MERDLFVRQRRQDDEQFRRRLRAVGFIHGNFGDKIRRAFGLGDVAVDFPGVLHRQQELVRPRARLRRAVISNGWSMRGMENLPVEFGMLVHERLHVRGGGGLADGIRHINREKIRRRDETIHGFEADVVGVHVIGFFQPNAFTAASASARRLEARCR